MSILNSYLTQIQEGYILTDKSFTVDLQKFENGESKILLIDGISGSGKSTLGKKLAKKYKCKLWQSDFPCLSEQDKHDPVKCFQEKYRKIKKSNQRYIVEGVMVHFSCLDGWHPKLTPFFNEIKYDPIIVVGASILITMYRYYKQSDQEFWKFIRNFLKFGRYYSEEMGPYRFFVKKRLSIKGADVKSYKI